MRKTAGEQQVKIGHPGIYLIVKEHIRSPKFVNSLGSKLKKDFESGSIKNKVDEKQLKLLVVGTLIEELEQASKGKTFNLSICSEMALPAKQKLAIKTHKIITQEFDWIEKLHKECSEVKNFMPPTDVVVNTCGWIPDPVFGYSLATAIELKANTTTISAMKDIHKLKHFLEWRKDFYENINLEKMKLNKKYKHIYGEYEKVKNDCFCCFFIYVNKIDLYEKFSKEIDKAGLKVYQNNYNIEKYKIGVFSLCLP